MLDGDLDVFGAERSRVVFERLQSLTEVLAPYDPARLSTVARRDYVVDANWKVLHENYQECLHCPRIHPELCRVSPPDSGDNLAPGDGWVGGWMDLRDGVETMSITGGLAMANDVP